MPMKSSMCYSITSSEQDYVMDLPATAVVAATHIATVSTQANDQLFSIPNAIL